MSKLYIETREYTIVTYEAPSNSGWDRDCTHTDISIESISTNGVGRESVNSDEDVNVGDIIYLVWAHWGSGDSFGYNTGAYSEYFMVTTDKDKAERLRAFLENFDGYGTEFEGMKYYVPWNGYFDSLEGVYIWEGIVEDES